MDLAVLFETIMLVSFGFSWPFNIAKSLKSKTTLGKSVASEIIVVIGYFFGIAAKLIIYNRKGVLQYSFWFYILDILLVTTDIILYCRNYRKDKEMGRIPA